MISLTVSQLNLFISSLCVTATTTMISSDHRSGSSTSSFFSIPSCFFFFITLVLLSLSSSSSSANALSSHSQQCLDLLNLKKGFIMLNESYANYYSITSSIPHWRSGTDCCRWEGVSCDEASGLVVSLDLSDRLIGGDIMPSLFNLTSLQRLNLAFNFFNQSAVLHSDLEKLANLTHLNLYNSGLLEGQIPIGISRLTKLIFLDLSSDSYGPYALKLEKPDLGTIIRDLSNLKELILDGVNISFSGTEWCQAISDSVPGLQLLSLQDSSLSGPIDSSLSKLQNLSILRLDFNNLSSQVPDFIANFSSLTVLSLSGCELKGLFPTSIFELLNLKTLYLSYNKMLEGELVYLDLSHTIISPGTYHQCLLLPKLAQLYLADNKLSGQLQEFTNASSTLQYVALWGNNLHGKLPKSLVNLFALISLDLSSNNFDGSVMGLELFGHLQNLTYLDLSGIDLISDQIAGSSRLFQSLDALILQSCNLMAIPSFLKHKKSMKLLDLSKNKINGIIPKWILSVGSFRLSMNLSCNLFTDIERPLPNLPMMSIDSLDLHSNMLQGQIPLLQARFLDYSNNSFTGSIPFNISAYLLCTSALSLANNNLTGDVPASICDTYLEILDLSKNSLSGSIQGCLLESLSNLHALNLRENQFQGILPRNINSSCSLVTINFYGNKLEGEIPKSLAKCEKLEFLDLGSNKLAGSFPYWLGNLPSLKVLVLSENGFYGRFECPPGVGDPYYHFAPPSAYFEDLVTVTAKGSKRELVKIPTTTAYIDVSNNRFEGVLPEVIGDLKSLHFLNMSLNAFKGHIPQVLENLRDLESLDLSGNQLSGEIPNSLTSLTFLSFLNLSNNNLVGRIPQGNQFNTFSNSSFEGNPGLCGSPLSRQCVNSTSTEPSTDLNNASPELDMEAIWIWMFRGLGFGVGFALAFCHQVLFAKLKIWYKR
ncbi:Leucine-rich repeat protein, partial [Dioscorea alata]